MAKHPQGILGPFIGRIGPIVGYMLGDINVTRSIGKRHGPRTPKQYANETRMGLISSLSCVIEEFLNFGFRSVSGPGKQDPRNHCIKINKQTAVKGVYPNIETDFSKLIVADGIIPAPKMPKAKITNNRLDVTWKADMEAEGTNERDQVMILAYFPSVKKAVVLASGARRIAEIESINLPEFGVQTVVEVYMAFVADDRKNASPSVYLGQMILSEGKNGLEEGFKYISEAIAKENGKIKQEEGFSYLSDPVVYNEDDPDQVLKMKIVSPFLSQFRDEVSQCFPERGVVTGYNKAISYNLKHAINGFAPHYRIEFSKVKLSMGKRETAWSTKFILQAENTIAVKWAVPETANMKLIGDDIAYIGIYNKSQHAKIHVSEVTKRKELAETIVLKGIKPGDVIVGWIFFISADGTQYSNTDYLGEILIPK